VAAVSYSNRERHWIIKPLAWLVVVLWLAAGVVWFDYGLTLTHRDPRICRTAIWRDARAAQAVDPTVREINVPRECRGFTQGELTSIVASLVAAPAPTPTPSASPSPTPSRSVTPRRSSPAPSRMSPSPSAAVPTLTPTPTPSPS
jgi:hypothetical protein